MAAPPNLPPIPPSDYGFVFGSAFSDPPIPAFIPRSPPPPAMPPPSTIPSDTAAHTLSTPPPGSVAPNTDGTSQAAGHRRRSRHGSRSRSESRDRQGRSRSGSRNRSRSPSTDHTGSEESDSDAEENVDPRYQWRPIEEDKSTPCEDEIKYIESKPEYNISALDDEHWSKKTFFALEDESFNSLGQGTIDWTIDHFNGTKELPNNDQIMRSPPVRIGGYDWQIAFYPRGNRNSNYLCVYLECPTMRSDDFQEFEDYDPPPFPFLEGEEIGDSNKKRRSIAVQLSVILYNPAEPRTHKEHVDAHRFSKHSPDYGWSYFAHREDFHVRLHGQRQAILRDDKLAFRAYIRILDDPTGAMWAHEHTDSFRDSLMSTGLRPFAGQPPHLAALLPLLHFEPFRRLIAAQRDFTRTVYKLQTLLWKMYSRTHSESYGRRPDKIDTADAVSCLKAVRELLGKELGEDLVSPMLGSVDPERGSLTSSNRIPMKGHKTLQEAIDNHPTPIETPVVLTVELQRQEFDSDKRRWKKLTNRTEVNNCVLVGGVEHDLLAVVTHCGDLSSNRHNVYVKPYSSSPVWYGYQDRRVVPMTHKQAVTDHEGADMSTLDMDKRRDSPFSGIHDRSDNAEVIYLAMFVRADYRTYLARPATAKEHWDVPTEIRNGQQFPRQKEAYRAPRNAEEATDLPFRAEQDRFEEEKAALEAAMGAATPEWPLTDEEGDTIMSDAEDDSPPLQRMPSNMTGSITLTQISTKPSRCRKWLGIIDSLGRDWYKGELFGDKYQGHGELITMSGDHYLGAFYNGKQEGYGKMIGAATGNVYEGEWEKGLHHGHGKLTEASTGNIWEGGWKEGKKHGEFVHKGRVTEDDRGLCSICMDKEMTTAFYDCGHVVACHLCAQHVDNCPVCRRRVVGRLQIYGVKMTLE